MRTLKKHYLLLVIITLLVRGVMFISYPIGGADDDQSYARYQIDHLIQGDLRVGNLRYHTGYPLVIAPVAALASHFDRIDDRIVLAVQILLAATVPFMVYDIVQRRRSPNEALFVALIVALDPFGLQWAHFSLPNWLIGFCLIAIFWLIDRSLRSSRWLIITLVAGLVGGIAVLARINMLITIAIMGVCFFGLTQLSWTRRFMMFTVFGMVSAGVLGLYMVGIHYPSTGVWRTSCHSGTNLLVSVTTKGMPVKAANGAASQAYLQLWAMKPLKEITFYADSYPLWSNAGVWASPDEAAAFEAQTPGEPATELLTDYPGYLYYYVGLCKIDDLMGDVAFETVRAEPVRWFGLMLQDTLWMLTQQPGDSGFGAMWLPRYDEIRFTGDNRFGFQIAEGGFYTGQTVWKPGITLYSALFFLSDLLKLLTPLALIRALFTRDWFYITVAILLTTFMLSLSIFGNLNPRLYAPVYPLAPILIGLLCYSVIDRLKQVIRREPV